MLGSGLGNREKIVMVFDGSVKGLNIGAPVALRGVQVGQVTTCKSSSTRIQLDIIMLVEADFSATTSSGRQEPDDVTEELIQRGLRAQLNTQSLLTGLLYIQLDFHPNSELILADIDSPYFQFPTIPTDLERIATKLQYLDFTKLPTIWNSASRASIPWLTSADFQACRATYKPPWMQ